MTTEELFAQMEAQAATEKEYCVIDPITREISVPEVYQKIGVVSDEKTNRIYFQCPRIVGDNVDLTKYGIRVNYQNANGQTKPYPVDDVAVSGDNIRFSWLLERPVTTYKGTVNFVVCAIKTSGDEITNEWNTTLAQSEVLEGLEPDIAITEDEESIVELLVAQCTQKLTEMNMAIQTAENATSDAKTATQEAVNATEDARSVIEQITKDSYLHTALESFINEVTAKPTAYGNALVEKIEGYIRQTSTKGNQLFDSSSLTAYNEATFSVLNGGKDVKVTGRKTSESAKSSVIYQIKSALFELIKGKTLYVYVNHDAENGWFEFGIQSESTGWTYRQITNKQWTEVNVPSDLKTTSIALIPNAKTEENITATFKDIKIGLSQFEEWEAFTGGEPAPSPDYPQVIHGVGDMGFFDGELLQGGRRASDGVFEVLSNSVSNANKTIAKSGDVVRLKYDESVQLVILAYSENGSFLGAENKTNVTEIEYALPSNTDHFYFDVIKDNITPQTAKHITVTINGMYAICVKTVGKNLIDFDKEYKDYGINGEYKTTAQTFHGIRFNIKKYIGKQLTFSAMLKSDVVGVNPRVIATVSGTIKQGNIVTSASDYEISKISFIPETENDNIYISYGNLNSNTIYVKNPQLEIGESATDYIPYQGNTTYIPISSPLFAGDQLIKRNMERKTYRKMGFAIFDGSEDENWEKSGSKDWTYFVRNLPNCKYKGTAYCNWLENESETVSKRPSIFIGKDFNVYFAEGQLESDTLESLKVKLAKTPMMLIYELNSQIEEELSPEAQKAIHSIMACDEQTMIEIVGVPTDAEVQNQFLLPRNVDGALNTTAFSTSKRNEITLEEQQTATEARLQAIEAQILKEV